MCSVGKNSTNLYNIKSGGTCKRCFVYLNLDEIVNFNET